MLRALKDRKTSLAIFCIAGITLLTVYISIFPMIQKQTQQLEKVMKAYPEAFLKAFNIEDMSFSTVEKFLAAEQYSFTWPLLAMFLAISFSSSIVRDIERGTIDFMLTRPISRVKLYFGRALASSVAVLAFVLFSIAAAVPIAKIAGIEIAVKNHVLMTFVGFLFGISIVGIASLIGAWASERGRANMMTGGILVVMYVANILAQLKDNLHWMRYISLFHYFDSHAALIHGELNVTSVLVLLAVAIVTLACGAFIFNKRDIYAAA